MNTTTLNMTTLDGGVIIKRETAPAPPSGGEESASTMEYLDVREAGLALRVNLITLAESVKCKSGDMKIVGLNSEATRQLGGIPDPEIGDYLAVGIDFSRKTKMFNGDLAFDGTIMEMLTMMGIPQTDIDALPHLTKEQFYSLD